MRMFCVKSRESSHDKLQQWRKRRTYNSLKPGGVKLLRNQDGIYSGASAAKGTFPTPGPWILRLAGPPLPVRRGGHGVVLTGTVGVLTVNVMIMQ